MAQDGSVQKVYADLEKKMNVSLDAFRKELNSIRTGRASLALLDGISRPILRGAYTSQSSRDTIRAGKPINHHPTLGWLRHW